MALKHIKRLLNKFVTDGRTDGRTDRRTEKLLIDSRSTQLKKISVSFDHQDSNILFQILESKETSVILFVTVETKSMLFLIAQF